MRVLMVLFIALPLTLLSACSGEDQDSRDAALETAVDQATIEGPKTQPVEDAFVPLDGRTDVAADTAAVDASAVDAGT